ncbi:hypothetical protein ACFYTQ_24790 [Nocardia sp. NPDC004068]|uniref:hypothetical protein n=1 Tax=Nocardia sp. NPDC004068 TaxID=3364303 RepID=UPI0036C85478
MSPEGLIGALAASPIVTDAADPGDVIRDSAASWPVANAVGPKDVFETSAV